MKKKIILFSSFIIACFFLSIYLPVSATGTYIIEEEGQFYDDSGEAIGLFVSGNYVYVADGIDGLEIIDITDPSNPTEVGNYYNDSGEALEVFVSGNYAFVADKEDGLEIIDISTPSSPTKIGAYSDGEDVLCVAVSGNYAYIGDTEGVKVIDVSTPSSPTKVDEDIVPPFPVIDVLVVGDILYTIGGNYFTYDISTPSALIGLGAYLEWAFQLKVAVSGDLAYIARSNGGFYIVDVSDPSDPFVVGGWQYGTLTQANDVAADGTLVFSAYGPYGIYVVNVTYYPLVIDPEKTDIDLQGQYFDDSGVAKGILIDENFIYIADGTDGLEILEYAWDSDEDGLSDDEETTLGDDGYITDPDDPDSDDDGYTDKEEFDAGTNPNDPEDYPVTETAGLTTGILLIISFLSLFSLVFISTKRKK
ncbi:MAG: hypothetical protein FK731_11180 [Asgard group archaeon]|nr:hypothetical protein [Asgard group archaeon]